MCYFARNFEKSEAAKCLAFGQILSILQDNARNIKDIYGKEFGNSGVTCKGENH